VSLLQLALSRNREFDADDYAADLTGDPAGLASALRKIEREQASIWRRLFQPYVRGDMPTLLRSHPKTEERVARLLARARE
jgi:heat shock protein HtpX